MVSTIYCSLTKLSSLHTLEMRLNDLSGDRQLDTCLSDLTSLVCLNLSGCGLKTVPERYGVSGIKVLQTCPITAMEYN